MVAGLHANRPSKTARTVPVVSDPSPSSPGMNHVCVIPAQSPMSPASRACGPEASELESSSVTRTVRKAGIRWSADSGRWLMLGDPPGSPRPPPLVRSADKTPRVFPEGGRFAAARSVVSSSCRSAGDFELILGVLDPLLELPAVGLRLARFDLLELGRRGLQLPTRPFVVDLLHVHRVVD